MTGEINLNLLLAGAQPVLDPTTYVFATSRTEAFPVNPAVIGAFRENEGTSIIAEQQWAEDQGMKFIFPCRRITLTIHSSLEAVGLMAAVSSALASAGISTNPVSGYYHDHLFVPERDAILAMTTLETLIAEAR